MKPLEILSIVLLIIGLLLIYFTSSAPMTILAVVLILIGAAMVALQKRK